MCYKLLKISFSYDVFGLRREVTMGHLMSDHFKMHLKVVRYQMSHYYLCSKSKTIMKKSYCEFFIADYFPTLNKKDPVHRDIFLRSFLPIEVPRLHI